MIAIGASRYSARLRAFYTRVFRADDNDIIARKPHVAVVFGKERDSEEVINWDIKETLDPYSMKIQEKSRDPLQHRQAYWQPV